jgi:hypothetical protein
MPAILPLRARADLEDKWLKERLDTLVPALMREHGIDMWVLVAREYLEDPVMWTMLNATSMHARRRTVLIFFDPGDGKPVERLVVNKHGMGDMFKPAWDMTAVPDQWERIGQLISERNPSKIAVNTSADSAFADGITQSQYAGLMAALTPEQQARVVPAFPLAIGWLETRIPAEMDRQSGSGLVVSPKNPRCRPRHLVSALSGNHQARHARRPARRRVDHPAR